MSTILILNNCLIKTNCIIITNFSVFSSSVLLVLVHIIRYLQLRSVWGYGTSSILLQLFTCYLWYSYVDHVFYHPHVILQPRSREWAVEWYSSQSIYSFF